MLATDNQVNLSISSYDVISRLSWGYPEDVSKCLDKTVWYSDHTINVLYYTIALHD